MEEVFKMHAMSDGEANAKPAESDRNHDGFEEDEEVETSGILTSSDDDEGVSEDVVIVFVDEPAAKPAVKKAAKKKTPAKKAAKKAPAKKAPAK